MATSHLNEPLDKNPFASLKESFNAEMCKYNHRYGTKVLTKEHSFEVFNIAWEKAMTKKNILAGLKYTGLWPPNRHAFKPDQLGPSAVNDKCELCIGIKNLKLCLAFSFRNLVQMQRPCTRDLKRLKYRLKYMPLQMIRLMTVMLKVGQNFKNVCVHVFLKNRTTEYIRFFGYRIKVILRRGRGFI